MTSKQRIIEALEGIPEKELTKILSFIELIKSKNNSKITDILLISESTLAKDWLTEEEEEAWQDL
ncbi:MAG: hypothetical protein QNJ42_11290 [Crocosphaera sp.]|nr:hypothetical protein [Crocosphaera sp.]